MHHCVLNAWSLLTRWLHSVSLVAPIPCLLHRDYPLLYNAYPHPKPCKFQLLNSISLTHTRNLSCWEQYNTVGLGKGRKGCGGIWDEIAWKFCHWRLRKLDDWPMPLALLNYIEVTVAKTNCQLLRSKTGDAYQSIRQSLEFSTTQRLLKVSSRQSWPPCLASSYLSRTLVCCSSTWSRLCAVAEE